MRLNIFYLLGPVPGSSIAGCQVDTADGWPDPYLKCEMLSEQECIAVGCIPPAC